MEKTSESHGKRTLHKRAIPTIDVSSIASQAGRYFNEATRFARARPGAALGIAFGAGVIVGGSIANRLVRLAVYSAIGAGMQALLREAPAWLDEVRREAHVS